MQPAAIDLRPTATSDIPTLKNNQAITHKDNRLIEEENE